MAGHNPSVGAPTPLPGRGGRELAAVLGAAACLAVLLTFPFAAQMTHVGRIDNFDGQWGVWNVSWVARTLVADPAHVLDGNIFFPLKRTLIFSETNLGAGAIAIPAYWATRNPYFAFNFSFLLSMIASAAGGYYLVRYLVRDRRAAAVCGIAFAFCPYVFARTPQIHLLWTAGLPFCMLAFHRTADRPTAARAVVLGFVMAAQVLFSGYYAVFSMLMVGFATFVIAGTRRRWTDARYWRAIALAAAVAVVASLPLLIPYLQLQQVGFGRALADADRFSADWRAYFASSALAHRWMLPLLASWKEVLFPGFVTLIGGGLGLVIGLKNHGRRREIAGLYGGLGFLACWASFGPAAWLYTVFYRLIPPFALMRAPSRFGVVVTLALVVLAGVAIAELMRRTARPALVGAVLAALTAAELAVPLRFRDVPPQAPAYKFLATLPSGPVIELPFWSTGREMFGHARYMLNSTGHWMPLINGYSDYMPPDFLAAAPILKSFPSPEAFRALAAQRPRYAVFHMNVFGEVDRAAVAARIQEFAPYLRPLYTSDDTRLYEIVGFPP